ncbi:hypothetical protein OF83DRAFT_409616 [Amylostereum chailletii]|nr:hypothetical protein OF83DRAFT_409616 [Amylostereum chailletii]
MPALSPRCKRTMHNTQFGGLEACAASANARTTEDKLSCCSLAQLNERGAAPRPRVVVPAHSHSILFPAPPRRADPPKTRSPTSDFSRSRPARRAPTHAPRRISSRADLWHCRGRERGKAARYLLPVVPCTPRTPLATQDGGQTAGFFRLRPVLRVPTLVPLHSSSRVRFVPSASQGARRSSPGDPSHSHSPLRFSPRGEDARRGYSHRCLSGGCAGAKDGMHTASRGQAGLADVDGGSAGPTAGVGKGSVGARGGRGKWRLGKGFAERVTSGWCTWKGFECLRRRPSQLHAPDAPSATTVPPHPARSCRRRCSRWERRFSRLQANVRRHAGVIGWAGQGGTGVRPREGDGPATGDGKRRVGRRRSGGKR